MGGCFSFNKDIALLLERVNHQQELLERSNNQQDRILREQVEIKAHLEKISRDNLFKEKNP